MLGISLKPLGYDNEGVTFWKFPGSNLLFSSSSCTESLRRNGGAQELSSANALLSASSVIHYKSSPTVWHVVSDLNQFRSLIGKLGLSPNEMSLKYELLRAYKILSETVDFNIVLQDSSLSPKFMSKYCKYEEILCQNISIKFLLENLIDVGSICSASGLDVNAGNMVQTLQFSSSDGGSPVQPHVLLERNEELVFSFYCTEDRKDIFNLSHKYYSIVLSNNGSNEDSIRVMYQVPSLPLLLIYIKFSDVDICAYHCKFFAKNQVILFGHVKQVCREMAPIVSQFQNSKSMATISCCSAKKV